MQNKGRPYINDFPLGQFDHNALCMHNYDHGNPNGKTVEACAKRMFLNGMNIQNNTIMACN